MKRVVVNILATTGLAVVILSAVVRVLLPGYDLFFTAVVLQTFGANIVIHLGIELARRFEIKYLVLEVLLDMVYTTIVLIGFGLIFDWFDITPIWVLTLMAVFINLVAQLLNMFHVRKESNSINELIKKREKQTIETLNNFTQKEKIK